MNRTERLAPVYSWVVLQCPPRVVVKLTVPGGGAQLAQRQKCTRGFVPALRIAVSPLAGRGCSRVWPARRKPGSPQVQGNTGPSSHSSLARRRLRHTLLTGRLEPVGRRAANVSPRAPETLAEDKPASCRRCARGGPRNPMRLPRPPPRGQQSPGAGPTGNSSLSPVGTPPQILRFKGLGQMQEGDREPGRASQPWAQTPGSAQHPRRTQPRAGTRVEGVGLMSRGQDSREGCEAEEGPGHGRGPSSRPHSTAALRAFWGDSLQAALWWTVLQKRPLTCRIQAGTERLAFPVPQRHLLSSGGRPGACLHVATSGPGETQP